MKAVKNGEISQLSSVIKSLESKIVSLETQIQYSKNNYDELIELLKPLLHDLLDKSEGHSEARKNQMKFKRWPRYNQTEIEAAVNVLSSGKVNYWTGNECKSFEKEFANYVGSKFAVAVANGTLALDACYKAIGIRE